MLNAVLLAALCAAVSAAPPQDPPGRDPQLPAAVLAAERARVEVMARVAPAVCAVMPLDKPGGGSGVIIDPLGFVLTNFHVVGKPDVKQMKVGLPDGHLYRAAVLGVDPGSDLAVLLLEPRTAGSGGVEDRAFPAVELGDSDQLLAGQAVFAMGNPFLLATDFRPTTTFGIVSANHRYQPGQGNRQLVYPDCIQVDAPVNPGNSGGPLFDLAGRVMGINGRISIRDGRGKVNVGVGFAIAANQCRNFLADLYAGRFAEHGTLDLNAWFRDSGEAGGELFVQSLFADSRAAASGVGLGDLLTSLDGRPLRSANELARRVGVLPEGAWVSLGHRPRRDDGGYATERRVEFPLPRLDTGSSRQPDRLASAAHRSLALRALARPIGAGEPSEGASLTITGPDGQRVELHRRGEALRIDQPDHVLLLTTTGDAVRIEGGAATPASEAEQSKLQRILTTNPWLWRGPQWRALLEDAELLGGVTVRGRPAFRAGLPGAGDREIWFGLDGTPLGCRYHDPVQDAGIELRGCGAGSSRIVKDGRLAAGWQVLAPRYEVPAAELFTVPTRRPR